MTPVLSVNSEVRDLSARASRGPAGPARGSDGACGHGVRVRGDIVRSCPSCGLAASLYRAYTPEGPLVDAVARQSPSPGVRARRVVRSARSSERCGECQVRRTPAVDVSVEMETPTPTAGARGRARHREVPRTSREQPSKAQGIGREQPMPKRAIDPRTSRDAVVLTGAGIALERAASGRRRWQRWAASHTSREQLHRRQVSRRSGAKASAKMEQAG